MKTVELSMTEIMILASTRAMAGAGAALLVSGRLNPDQRKAVGWTLFLIGALSTIPIAANICTKECQTRDN